MAATILLLLACTTSLPILVDAQLSLLSSRGRPFSLSLRKGDPSPQRAMESDIAAIFRAAAYGTSTPKPTTTASSHAMISTEVTSSAPVTTRIETSSSTVPSSTVTDTDVIVSSGVNIKDFQHEEDVIEMKSFISMEENYRRHHNQDRFKNRLLPTVVTTETYEFDTRNFNNKQLQNLNSTNSSEFSSWGRVYIAVGLLSTILMVTFILTVNIVYRRYRSKDNSSVNTVCGKSNIFSSYSLKPEFQGISPNALDKQYISVDINADNHRRIYNNYGQTKSTFSNNKVPRHGFINGTDSSMLVHDGGFVRFKSESDSQNLQNEQIRKPTLNLYQSVAPTPANTYSYCESGQTSYYCVPMTQDGLVRISTAKSSSSLNPRYCQINNIPTSVKRDANQQMAANTHYEPSMHSDIYSHPNEINNTTEEQFKYGFIHRLGRTTANTCGYGYAPLEGVDTSFSSDTDTQ
ncbi:unnamed protein product, partial [Meganyctiphanes norvegica]